MISFDASDKYVCTVKRQSTNTPLQALVLMNDPQYIEAARVLAEKMIKSGGPDAGGQITFGFRVMTSRTPEAAELKILKELYQSELIEYEKYPVAADELLNVGESPRDQTLPKNKVAALTVVASAMINYDASVFKR